MIKYTTSVTVNDMWRDILIYESDTPLTFEDLEVHRGVEEQGDSIITTTYYTEPIIFRSYTPASDGKYYYWFIIRSVEREVVVTNGDRVAALESALDTANAKNAALVESQQFLEDCIAEMAEVVYA